MTRLLLDSYPYDADPPIRPGFQPVQSTDTARSIRNHAVRLLADAGAVAVLHSLQEARSTIDQRVLRDHERVARARQADLAIAITPPTRIIELLSRFDNRLVHSDADLLEVIVEQLNWLQQQITYNGAFKDLWNGEGDHKSEDDISDWIRRNLGARFDRNIVIDREVQVQRPRPRGIGTRIDITATSVTATQPPRIARVILEAKHVTNDELYVELHRQLVDRYLVPSTLTHGIYLVYWVAPDQRTSAGPSTPETIEDLDRELRRQAMQTSKGIHVHPYILDISRPTTVARPH